MERRAILLLILMVSTCLFNIKTIDAFKTFGFDVHHRYSDAVKEFLTVDGLPEKGSVDYFAAMAHRDRLFKARHLATTSPTNDSVFTFLGGNTTFQLRRLGFLHYSVVSVGTPPLRFLVALDTGSDLFWLPCDCANCLRSLNSSSGQTLDLNIYSPSNSSTSMPVPCNSTMCRGLRRGCSTTRNACAYQERYLSANTSTTGILVDDVLHLGTDTNPQSPLDVPITLGCGIVQTGDFLTGAGVNGLFGLGMDSDSVPSILASKGIVADSFSMCFGPDGIGRIDFGDKTSPGQNVTPFNILPSQLNSYNVTTTQVAVGGSITNLQFTAIFDSGTSFTYLNDPAYTAITEAFDSKVKDQARYQPQNPIIFDYCYSLSATQDVYYYPEVNLTMKGGDQFYVTDPTVVVPREDGGLAFCLAIVKSDDINLIGQNFMTGYRVYFDREKMVLGWKESDCYDSKSSKNGTAKPVDNSSMSPPPPALQPRATPTNRTLPPISSSPPLRPLLGSSGARLDLMNSGFFAVVISIFLQQFMVLSP